MTVVVPVKLVQRQNAHRNRKLKNNKIHKVNFTDEDRKF
jgi:hypothetical protein